MEVYIVGMLRTCVKTTDKFILYVCYAHVLDYRQVYIVGMLRTCVRLQTEVY